jgi:antitoxin (DNA-binding transcriptional repressor) of toxin-antitoxin stability system
MALKSDRNELQTDISFFMNETATRGGVVSISTGGSGAAMDQGAALVTYTAASGKPPIGILLNDMVNLDLTRQHINQHKDEVQKGGKVTILRKGYVVTNSVAVATAVAAGDPAFVSHGGNIANSGSIADHSGNTGASIGTFLSSIDEDGYYKVEINLPQTRQSSV